MLIDKESLYVDGINFGKYLKQAEILYSKAWGDDAGRDTLSGDFSGTFKGIYPKIICTFLKLKQSDIETLAPILDKPEQSVTYYDVNKKQKITIKTYSNDWGIVSKRLGKAENVSISFISRKKRA